MNSKRLKYAAAGAVLVLLLVVNQTMVPRNTGTGLDNIREAVELLAALLGATMFS